MHYVRNAWYVASWAEDIAAEKPHGTMILGEPIVIWRDDGGTVHALEDRCVHRLAPLSLGRCEGANLRCGYHGFLFDPDGAVIGIPGQSDIPSIARVKRYHAFEQDSWIWIWMGEPELADPSAIPRVTGIDDPGWALGHGKIDYLAEARLLNDNLTDLSHLPFVHGESFAATDDFVATLPTVTAIEGGIRVERWAENQPPLGVPDAPERFDAFLGYDYLVPGIMRLTARVFPLGTFRELGPRVVPPADMPSNDVYSAQAITPTGKGKTRYFFSNGPRAPVPKEFSDFLWDVTLAAFAEDRAMIEGQQRVIDLDPERKIMPAVGDKGTVLYNRVVDRMVRAEQDAATAE